MIKPLLFILNQNEFLTDEGFISLKIYPKFIQSHKNKSKILVKDLYYMKVKWRLRNSTPKTDKSWMASTRTARQL